MVPGVLRVFVQSAGTEQERHRRQVAFLRFVLQCRRPPLGSPEADAEAATQARRPGVLRDPSHREWSPPSPPAVGDGGFEP